MTTAPGNEYADGRDFWATVTDFFWAMRRRDGSPQPEPVPAQRGLAIVSVFFSLISFAPMGAFVAGIALWLAHREGDPVGVQMCRIALWFSLVVGSLLALVITAFWWD